MFVWMRHMVMQCYWLVLVVVWASVPVNSQERCPMPSFALPVNAPNFFTEQQENDFGDAVSEQIQSEFTVIDDEVKANLDRIGQRLVDQLPASGLRFRFYLMDFPQVNAFSLPGGRIYVARKLVAACRNEDELAGVLAHEIGHVITRHSAIDLSHIFKKLLGISSFGDRKDIFQKFNQLLDNMARNPGALKGISKNEAEEQITADRVSLFLSKRAGYSPEAFIQFWDRVAETGGKTGSALGDLFGSTKPEQKRLREMQRLVEQLPAACEGPRPSSTGDEFQRWKTAVMEYSGLGHGESLPVAERKQLLNPRLRGNITHMRFSRNGKYLLAQDSASVFVLSREPFNVLFRIDAQNALPAQFTPDSELIVFNTQDLRVEKWNIAEARRTSLHEVAVNTECVNARLSPDAKYIACLDSEYKLTVLSVSDGSRVFQKAFSSYGLVAFSRMMSLLLGRQSARLEFSPDGRYFVGADSAAEQYIAYDFADGQFIKLPGAITSRLYRDFGFMSGNRFVGVAGNTGEKSAILSFPAGEVLHTMQTGLSKIMPVTQGDYLILSPIQKYPAGIMDLAQNKLFMALEQGSVDIYDKFFASEREDGVLYLFTVESREGLAKAVLPQSPLPRLKAASLSADMNWLAISESSRGAIWDLRNGKRTFLSRNFQGAQFVSDNTLLVDLPKKGEDQRVIARINPAVPSVVSSDKVESERLVSQDGLFLVEQRKNPDKPKDSAKTLLVVSSPVIGKDLWSRDYPKGQPWTNFNSDEDRAVFVWAASSEFVKEESKANPKLKKSIEAAKERLGDYYIQILQASTGKLLNTVYVETGQGSFRIRWAEIAGDYLTLYDNQNRLLVYSISKGERLGQIFGVNGSLSPLTPLLAAENKPGVLAIYSLPSMEERGKLVFTHPLVYVKFSRDGKQLFALTADQWTYLFNTDAILTRK